MFGDYETKRVFAIYHICTKWFLIALYGLSLHRRLRLFYVKTFTQIMIIIKLYV